jgi:uncharacterized membrane protein
LHQSCRFPSLLHVGRAHAPASFYLRTPFVCLSLLLLFFIAWVYNLKKVRFCKHNSNSKWTEVAMTGCMSFLTTLLTIIHKNGTQTTKKCPTKNRTFYLRVRFADYL